MNLPDHTQLRTELAAEHAEGVKEQSEHLYTQAQQYRIGSRAAVDDSHYTLVALEIHGRTVQPVYVIDTFATAQFAVLNDEDETDELEPAPDDPGRALAARNWAAGQRDQISQYGGTDMLWDNPTSAEQIADVIWFGYADRDWRIAEQAQRATASKRAWRIACVVKSAGDNQSAAARLLGLDQSRVSRAVEAAKRAPDHYGS